MDPEFILIAMGVDSAITLEFPKITKEQLNIANNIPKRIQKMALKCVKGELDNPKIDIRSYEWKTLHEALSKKVDIYTHEKIVNSFPEDILSAAGEYQVFVTEVRQHLKDLFPVSEKVTFLGPKQFEPDDLSTFHFYNQLNLINNPFYLFELIAAAALTTAQVEGLKEIYPEFCKLVDEAFKFALAEAALVKSYSIPTTCETGLGVWWDRRTVTFDPNHSEPAPKPKKRVSSLDHDLKTPLQKALDV
jgi:hypothetical protein